jgi:hypothetical protein
LAVRISFLTAASDRSSSGRSGAVWGDCFSGASSSGGLALMLLAMSLQPALSPSRIAVLPRTGDSLKRRLRLPEIHLQTNLSVFDANAPQITEFHV